MTYQEFVDRLKSNLRQPVNQWLAVTLIAVFAFWTILYYFVHKADSVANNYTSTKSAKVKVLK